MMFKRIRNYILLSIERFKIWADEAADECSGPDVNPPGTYSFEAISNSPTFGSFDKDIKILFEGQIIGAAQSMAWKPCEDSSENLEITLTRVRLSSSILPELFMRGMAHAKSQKLPLHIRVGKVEFVNCWMESSLYNYHAGDWLILEGVCFKAEKHRDV